MCAFLRAAPSIPRYVSFGQGPSEQRLLAEVYVEAKLGQFGAGSGAEPILDVGMSCLFHG